MNTSSHELTASEAAVSLNRSAMTITRWCKAGIFDGAYQDGPYSNSPWKIPVEAVEKLKASYKPQK